MQDLNLRPLACEGNPASERTQDSPSKPIEKRASVAPFFGPICSLSADVPAENPRIPKVVEGKGFVALTFRKSSNFAISPLHQTALRGTLRPPASTVSIFAHCSTSAEMGLRGAVR